MRRPIKTMGIVIMVAAMLTIAALTIASYRSGSDNLLLVTFPGLICGLLITGGHGGTELQETVAEIVAVGVNMAVVALPFLALIYWIPRGLHNNAAAKSRRA